MAEYINRNAVLGYLNDIWLTATPTDSTPAEDRQLWVCRCMGLQDAMDAVREFPSANVKPVVQGKWVEQPKDFDLCGVEYFACSQCGFECQLTYNYCPNCGAEMDKGDDNA